MLNVDGIVQREFIVGSEENKRCQAIRVRLDVVTTIVIDSCLQGYDVIVRHVSEELYCLLVQDSPTLLRGTWGSVVVKALGY
jgi:hypothetical protein